MKDFFKKLNFLLTSKDKRDLFFLLLFSILVSFIEVVGVGAIMPFISIATDFEKIHTSFFKEIYDFFGFKSDVNFVIFVGVVLIVFYIFRSVVNLSYFYFLNRFSQGRYHLLAYRLFERYLGMNYIDFINKNVSYLTKTIVNEANNLVQLISEFLFMISEMFILVFIYVMLLWVNWKMTLLLTIFLGLNVLILKVTISKKIKKAGEYRELMQRKFYEIMLNSFGNFKMIKLKSNDRDILEKFKIASVAFANSNITNATLAQVPRLFLEAIGFSLIALIIIYLVFKYQQDVSGALPILSMFVLGLYRLMPSVNRIMSAYNQILFRLKSLEIIHNDLLYEPEELGDEEIEFKEKITLKNLSFEYEKNKPILKDINLTIKKGEKIGIIGESGSGKSTLVDLIMGLYKPTNGKIFVDNVELNEKNVKSWRKKIGYIPQDMYLFDGSIAENVAFGEKVDEERIKEVLKMANLLDFLEKHHQGIYTRVGERGIKLSGGQKQRVLIARALYSNPEVLILDEATSALDTKTEEKIMKELYKTAKNKTMIIIAHRLSTLNECDRIVKIEDGKIN